MWEVFDPNDGKPIFYVRYKWLAKWLAYWYNCDYGLEGEGWL